MLVAFLLIGTCLLGAFSSGETDAGDVSDANLIVHEATDTYVPMYDSGPYGTMIGVPSTISESNIHTITFDTDGGSTIDPITQEAGSAVTAPDAPTKTGHTFDGWDVAIPTTMPDEDITIKAKWVINQYEVIYILDDAVLYTDSYDYGTELTVRDTHVKVGYVVTPWSTEDVEVVDGKFTLGDKDVTFTATSEIGQYTITFEDTGDTAIDEITLDFGAIVTAPDNPVRTGHTFLGWDKPIPATMPAENMTITALWKVNEYTITFNTDGGTPIDQIKQNYGTTIIKPADPTRTGYSFKGWDKEIPETMPAENMTITAKWEINTYTITFDTDGGTEIKSITKEYGAQIDVPADPTKKGHRFISWDRLIPSTMPAENMTITAIWEAYEYTITFNTDGGTPIAAITQGYGTTITKPADPTKTGYSFKGWDEEIPETMPAENMTITAEWEINEYKITFETGGGTKMKEIKQKYDTAITRPPDPEKEGHTFDGWDVPIPVRMPGHDMHITAKWTINNYTIIFETHGGTQIASITQKFGTDIIKPTDPTKIGHKFNGWDHEIPKTMPAKDMTITAKWEINKYSVIYKVDGKAEHTEKHEYGTEVTIWNAYVKTGYTVTPWHNDHIDASIGSFILGASDVVFEATSTINQYKVIYKLDSVELYTFSYDYNTSVTVLDTYVKVGYTVEKWSTKDVNVSKGKFTLKDKDVVFTATSKINQYTISFKNTGDTKMPNITLDYGAVVTPPADPVRKGYSFAGWDGTIPAKMPAGNITLTAAWDINQYTITFDSGGGTFIAPITQDYNSKITKPHNPERIGYTFDKWDKSIPSTMPAENITIVAEWKINQYKVIYKLDGKAAYTDSFPFGTEVTVRATYVKVGYTVTPWHNGALEIVDGKFILGASDTIFEATSTINQYKVTYKVDGEVRFTETHNYGTKVSVRVTYVKVGYTVTPWATKDIGITDGKFTLEDKDVTFTATSTINQYTISFVNTGDSKIAPITQNYGTHITVPIDPKWVGHTFKGWNLRIPDKMPANDMTITAYWTINKYNVVYKVDGAETFRRAYNYGTELTVRSAFVKTGYTVTEWSTEDVEVSGGKFLLGAKDVTFTATSTINKYDVTYKVDGEVVSLESHEYGKELAVHDVYVKTGYTVTPWFTFDVMVANGKFTIGASNVTFSATSTVNNYNVVYMLDGEVLYTDSYKYGTEVSVRDTIVKTGYIVTEWVTKDVEVSGGKFVLGAMDVTFKAASKIKQYTISFENTGDTEIKAITLDYNAPVPAPADPVKTGYTFAGWDKIIPTKMPAMNMTISGRWSINYYDVVYKFDGEVVHTQSYPFGTEVTVRDTIVKTGYTVTPWTTKDIEVTGGKFVLEAKGVTFTAKSTINKYDVIYKLDGAVKYKDTCTYGTEVTVREAIVMTGYTVTGWSTLDAVVINGKFVLGTTDVTFNATSTINRYDVIYKLDGSEMNRRTYDYGTELVVRAPVVKTGYTVTPWLTKDVEVTEGKFVLGASHVIFEASSTINQYTITFNTDTGAPILVITQNYNTEIAMPADPTKIGYTFKGWNKHIPARMPAEDMTITAIWEINKYNVVYMFDENVLFSDQYDYGTVVTVREAVVKTGYTVIPWTTEDAKVVEGKFTLGTMDVVFSSKSTINQYTITFETGNGTPITAIVQDYDTAITKPADPTWEGHTFKEWDKVVPARMPAEDMTITAIWEVHKYNVIYKLDEEVLFNDEYPYGTEVTVRENFTKTGYEVSPWSTKDDIDIVKGKFVLGARNVTFETTSKIKEYSITFDTDGGSTIDPITQDYDTDISAPADPTKTGHTFKGWNKPIPTRMPAEDMTITAIWEANKYDVVYILDGEVTLTETHTFGMVVTVCERFVKTGYTVTPWSTEDVKVVDNRFTLGDSKVTFTATSSINEYTITFETGGGTVIAAIKQEYNTKITKPADPTKVGHTFKEWDREVPDTMPGEDMTITAIWNVNEYKVTYMVDGKVAYTDSHDYGEVVTVRERFVKVGHSVTQWVTNDVEISGGKFILGALDVTFTATSSINEYTITFETGGGTVIAAIKQEYNTKITKPADPTKVGHTFKKWDREVPDTMPGENITITAIWDVNQYNVVYKVDGKVEYTDTFGYGTEVTIRDIFAKTGYTVTTWSSTDIEIIDGKFVLGASNVVFEATSTVNQYKVIYVFDGKEVYSDTFDYGTEVTVREAVVKTGYTVTTWSCGDVEVVDGKFVLGASNVVFESTSTVNQYTIVFKTDGGSLVEPVTLDYGSSVVMPADPTRAGYRFTGWSPNIPNTMPAENITLVAQWEAKVFVVAFDANGGETDGAPFNVTYGNTYGKLPTASRDGYVFKGWFDGSDSSNMITEETLVTIPGDHTLYAHWETESASTNAIIPIASVSVLAAMLGVAMILRHRP